MQRLKDLRKGQLKMNKRIKRSQQISKQPRKRLYFPKPRYVLVFVTKVKGRHKEILYFRTPKLKEQRKVGWAVTGIDMRVQCMKS